MKKTQTVSFEPSWENIDQKDFDRDHQYLKCMTWYHHNSSDSDLFDWTIEYLKSKNYTDKQIQSAKSFSRTKSFVFKYGELGSRDLGFNTGAHCRILMNGGVIPDRASKKLEKVLALITRPSKLEKTNDTEETEKEKVSVLDRTANKISAFLSGFEKAYDSMLLGQKVNFSEEESESVKPKFEDYVHPHSGKQVYMSRLLDWAKNIHDELSNKDTEIQKAYSIYGKEKVAATRKWLESIIAYVSQNKASSNRKPRKKKKKNPLDLVKKLSYCKENASLSLKSVLPSSIIGASKLVTYNHKTRMLTVFEASGPTGLTVKGTSILDFDVQKSKSRKIRKPEVLKKELFENDKIKGTRALNNYWNTLTTKDAKLKNRMNGDTLILGVY